MAGSRYAAVGVAAVANPKTVLGLTGNTTHRIYLYDFITGSSATPDDNAIHHYMQRFTVAASNGGAAVTPTALDPASPAALTSATQNSTGGTYTSGEVLLRIPMNQRATHRWVAAPEGELVTPATAANGIGYLADHASHTGQVGCTIHFLE